MIKGLINDMKYVKRTRGSKHFYLVLWKFLYPTILNPLAIVFFAYVQWWVMLILWIPFSAYSLLTLFYGRELQQMMVEFMAERQMRKIKKQMDKVNK